MTSEGKQNPAVVEIDARAVGLVSPLPQQVRARWDSWQADGLSNAVRREVSLDEIQSRLQAAEAKRAVRPLRSAVTRSASASYRTVASRACELLVHKRKADSCIHLEKAGLQHGMKRLKPISELKRCPKYL